MLFLYIIQPPGTSFRGLYNELPAAGGWVSKIQKYVLRPSKADLSLDHQEDDHLAEEEEEVSGHRRRRHRIVRVVSAHLDARDWDAKQQQICQILASG